MATRILQVDAFANRPFVGNPAAVCLTTCPREEKWMQDVAREMNLSETAFLYEEGDGYRLRWFTPKAEVDLCGHATLASAHVLWEEGLLEPGTPARFHTKSGLLNANREGDWIELGFPSTPAKPATPPAGLVEALGVEPTYVGESRLHHLLEVESEDVVRNMTPDFSSLADVAAHGVMVTSRAAMPGYDFVSRFFAPRLGVNEDPVTGSAHCCLGPFWMDRLGKSEFVAYQASSRGGTVRVRVGEDRVYLGGKAITVLRGELL